MQIYPDEMKDIQKIADAVLRATSTTVLTWVKQLDLMVDDVTHGKIIFEDDSWYWEPSDS